MLYQLSYSRVKGESSGRVGPVKHGEKGGAG